MKERNAQIALLKAKAKNAKADAQIDYYKTIDALEHKQDKARTKLRDGQAIHRKVLSVTYAVCVLADHLDAAAILAPTQSQSGRTAIQTSRFRPKQPIIAFTPNLTTVRRLSLFRGIYPHLILDPRDTDDMIEKVSKGLLKQELCLKEI